MSKDQATKEFIKYGLTPTGVTDFIVRSSRYVGRGRPKRSDFDQVFYCFTRDSIYSLVNTLADV